jgi:hypothetical protein
MTRYGLLQYPDRFELEAAARHHRSEVWADAIASLGHWVRAPLRAVARREEPAFAFSAAQRRLVH